jgi:hypothetical protein
LDQGPISVDFHGSVDKLKYFEEKTVGVPNFRGVSRLLFGIIGFAGTYKEFFERVHPGTFCNKVPPDNSSLLLHHPTEGIEHGLQRHVESAEDFVPHEGELAQAGA